MTLTLIFIATIIVNLFISNEVGKVAETRELGREKGFWISFILSPILGLLFVLASRPLSQEQVNQIRSQMIVTTPEQEARDEKLKNRLVYFLVVAIFLLVLIWPVSN